MRLIPFSINKGSPGLTLSAGTSNVESKVVEYEVKPGMNLVFLPDDTIELKDNGATETADSSYVLVQVQAPNKYAVKVLQQTIYGQVKFNADRNLKNKIGSSLRVPPFNLLQISITGSQALATATTAVLIQAHAEVP